PAIRATDPTQKDVGCRLHELLPGNHACTLIREEGAWRVWQMCLEHGGLRLLDLEEERICVVTTGQKRDEAAGADAAHADDLARHVDNLVAREQVALRTAHRLRVRLEDAAHPFVLPLPSQPHNKRWVIGDDALPVDYLGEFC